MDVSNTKFSIINSTFQNKEKVSVGYFRGQSIKCNSENW